MAFASLYPRFTRTRRIEDLCGTWDFQLDPEGVGVAQGWPEAGLPDPMEVPVPASFNDLFTDKGIREYYGDSWYARRFFVPGEWCEGNLDLRFDVATHRATVYVNGTEVASHEGGFTPFVAPIAQVVRPNDWNRVVVRVSNELTEQPWNLCDFQTGEGILRVDGNKKGAFTRTREPKAVAFLLRDRWTHIADYQD